MIEIIDAHAHIYPDKIADKATLAIGNFYDIEMQGLSGTSQNLISQGERVGVSKYVVHSVATTAHQVRSINSFINEQLKLHSEFIGFMTLHPDMTEEQIEEEVDWCIKNGFKGVKLHPDFQKFYIDDKFAQRIYQIVSDKMPILLHVGDDRFEYSKPSRLVKMAKLYPNVTFICAHLGGYLHWDEWNSYKGLTNVYFDTCSSLAFISPEFAEQIIRGLGVEKFFFSTDFPTFNAKDELQRFSKLNLTDYEREKIYSKNIKKLLKID